MARKRSDRYAANRDTIKRGAERLFALRGYAAVSMNDIACHCEVSKPLLYHYFRDKYELLLELITAHVNALEQGCDLVFSQVVAPKRRLREYIAAYMNIAAENPDGHRMYIQDFRSLELSDLERLSAAELRITGKISQAISGTYELPCSGELVSAVTGVLMGMANSQFGLHLSADGPAQDGMLEVVLGIFLDGVATLVTSQFSELALTPGDRILCARASSITHKKGM
jgi:TetR/AcrR family transcriptional regulator